MASINRSRDFSQQIRDRLSTPVWRKGRWENVGGCHELGNELGRVENTTFNFLIRVPYSTLHSICNCQQWLNFKQVSDLCRTPVPPSNTARKADTEPVLMAAHRSAQKKTGGKSKEELREYTLPQEIGHHQHIFVICHNIYNIYNTTLCTELQRKN